MSFSSEVKKELANIETDVDSMKAELYTIIRSRSSIMISRGAFEVEIITALNSTARRIVILFKKIYGVTLEIIAYYIDKLDYKTRFSLHLQERGTKILIDLGLLNNNYQLIEEYNYSLFKKDECKISAIRGAFLIQGSINDPSKSEYHLELIVPKTSDAEFLRTILEEVNIFPKVIERKKGFVLYLKKSEQIGDFLRFTGAVNSLFYFEDQRIKRDYNNYANRLINCDIANEEKAIKSASRQLQDIEYLDKNYGIMKLNDRLIDAIVLRNTYPDDSLSQLSEKSEELIGRYISKSGLSHCYHDIRKLVDDLKQKRGEKSD